MSVDFEFLSFGVCPPRVQGTPREDYDGNGSKVSISAYPIVLHGRDRRCFGFPERLHCCKLHQRQDKECPIHHHLSQVGITPLSLVSCSFLPEMTCLSSAIDLLGYIRLLMQREVSHALSRRARVLTDLRHLHRQSFTTSGGTYHLILGFYVVDQCT